MFDQIRVLFQRIAEVREVDALTDRHLADLGMTRAQVHAFVNMPKDIGQRVAAMGAIFGLSEAELQRDRAVWVELLSTCSDCTDRCSCDRVLALGDLAYPEQADFCPNRTAFADLFPNAT